MKNLLLFTILLFSFFGYAQITVDETLTTQQLVEDILINSTCAEVSNFIQSTGTDFGDDNGIAAFDANGSDFPYASGIVLTTGNVANAPGPNLTLHSDGGTGWPGDIDLETVTTATNTNNASYIQFDFIPSTNEISFDFIFASEEYDQNFECTFSDAFAFILTDQVTGVVQNLAVLPGTTIPIEVTNIHPEVVGQCPAINEEYFDKYNFEPFNPAALAAIDFNGQIVSLTAMGPVIAGNDYTIKLVIADETDTNLDSAVFLRAGSFSIGNVDLGIDLTVATGNARCDGEDYTIVPDVTGPTGTTYEWQYEDPLGSGVFVPFVPAETGLTLQVSVTGNYKLIVNFGGACQSEGTVYIEFAPPIVINPAPASLVVCDADNDGFAEFTLHDADMDITISDPDLFVTYHPTLLDAQNEINELADPYTNDSPFTDVVFARVGTILSSCFEITTLTLEVRDTPMILEPSEPLRLCDYNNPGDGLEVFDLTVVEMEVLDGLDPLLYDIYYYELEADAIIAGDLALTAPDFSLAIGTPGAYQNVIPLLQVVYILVVGNSANTMPNNGGNGCYAIVPLTLIVDPLPVAVQALPYELCDDDLNGSTLTDQISTFDLTTREDEITGGDPTLSVIWYETLADEIADTPILTPTAYQNREIPPAPLNPQTIIARVTSSFGCKVTTTLTLVVNPNPSPVSPTPLEVCDDDNDGFAEFTLEDKDVEIIGGEPDVTVVYYLTEIDARLGDPAGILVSPYANVVVNLQTVWARVENTLTGCFSVIALDLVVNPLPDSPVVPGFGDLLSCDVDGGGSAIFNLEDNTPFVYGVQDPLDYSISYHTDAGDADAGINPVGVPTAFVSTGQTIWVRLENNETLCYRVSSFELIVGIFPLIASPGDMEVCDDEAGGSTTDGIAFFDLTLNDGFITMGDPDLTVFYYETAADQAAGIFIDPATAYENLTNPMTLFVSVFNSTGCDAQTTITLFVNPNPTPVIPTPLEVCDDDSDGFAEFTLEDKDAEIIGGEPGVTVVYYLTQIDARLGDPAGILVSPYANVVANLQTVWARVENILTGCFTLVTLDLIVNPLPDSPVVPGFGDLISCDVDGGGSATFNLEDNTPFVYGVQDPLAYSISYHVDAGDADAGINPVGVPTVFISTGQTIWVRLENNETLCYRVSSFDLIVGVYPLIASPGDMEVCDDEAGGSTTDGIAFFDLTLNDGFITMGDPDLTVFYYETAADQAAGIFIDPATAYENLTNPMTLFVSVFNSTGCDAQTTLSLFVNPNPSSVAPTPLVFCDPNGDGFGEFMLTDKDAEIIGGEPGVMVSYHETLADAENNIFALTSPYANIVANAQTVYARAYFEAPPTSTGCYSIVPLDLIVSPGPEVPIELPPLVLCDDDGFGIFDLTQQDALIYGVQDPSLFILTYHVSLADALSGLNPIATPETFVNTITPEQTIYYRLALIESGCFATGEFLLQVSLGPVVIQPEPLNSCDDLGEPNDGITTFDLTLKSDEITGGAVGVEVRYYETQEDADGDINRIAPETAYVNTTNPQTVYVRVIDGNTECYDTSVTLSLRVVPNPTPVTPTPIELCDDTNPGDGMEVFDLTIREGEILNGATWDLLYYEDEMEAIAGDPAAAIVDPTMYTNLSTPQIIYVRVMIPISSASPDGCFEIVELEIIVHPLPDDTALVTPYVICEIGSDGLFIFDLTTKIPEILGGQDPLLFAVTFYHSSSDAMVGLNPIINTTTYQNISNPETIYTGIVNVVTGCYIGGVQFFDLEVLEGATATPPAEPYTICDNTDPNDGIADFTLYNLVGDPDPDPMADALAAEILGGQSTPPYELLYYGTLADAELGDPTLVLPNVYTNVINPQVIYGRVTNTDTGCYEIVEVILKVEQLPFVNLAEFYRLCVDANGNPIPEEEGELSPPVIDTGLDPAFYDIVWEYPGGTAVGPSIIAIVEGVYTVTYTEIETGCSGTSSTTVTISQPPITYDAILLNGAFSENQSIQASATGLGTYVFQLDNGAFIDSGLFEDVSPGTHTITIKDVNGCGSVTIEIGVVDYPQFMTPNQDGYHDTWNIIGIAEFDPTAKIYIFDRFGKLLKQVSPLGDGWDGTYNGNPLPSSDYWFLIEYTEDDVQKEFKGHFTLKR